MFVVYFLNDNFGGVSLEMGLKGGAVSVAVVPSASYCHWKKVGNSGLVFRVDTF